MTCCGAGCPCRMPRDTAETIGLEPGPNFVAPDMALDVIELSQEDTWSSEGGAEKKS